MPSQHFDENENPTQPVFGYSDLLSTKTVEWLKKANSVIGIWNVNGLKKRDLIDNIIGNLNKWFPSYFQKLTRAERNACSILAANKGIMYISKLSILTEISIEPEEANSIIERDRWQESFRNIDLVLFDDAKHSFFSSPKFAILPAEILDRVPAISVDTSLKPVNDNQPKFQLSPDFIEVLQVLFRELSVNAERKFFVDDKISSTIISKVFSVSVESAEFFRPFKRFKEFTPNQFNEILSGFIQSSGIVKVRNGKPVLRPDIMEEMLIDRDQTLLKFFKWWESSARRDYTGINRRYYEFEAPMKIIDRYVSSLARVIGEILQFLPPGKLYRVADLCRRVKLEVGDRAGEYVVYDPDGYVDDPLKDFVIRILTIPLSILGIVSISEDRSYFVINTVSSGQHSGIAKIRILPDFEVFMDEGVDPGERLIFSSFAETISNDGHVTVSKITRESFIHSLRLGLMSLEKFRKLIERDDLSFPENVISEFRSWISRYGEVSIKRRSILSCRDKVSADLIYSDALSRSLILSRLGDTDFEIKNGEEKKLMDRIDSLGLMTDMMVGDFS